MTLSGQYIYGGFWIRVAAKILDGIIMGIVNGVLIFGLALVFGAATRHTGNASDSAAGILAVLTFILEMAVGIGYIVFFVGKYGATPGKMACGLKIIRPDGSPMTYGRAFIRWLAELVNSFTVGIGYLIAAFDDEKRGLHDRIADTRVIRK